MMNFKIKILILGVLLALIFSYSSYSQESNYEKALLDLKLDFLDPSQKVNLTEKFENKIINDLFNKYGTNRKFKIAFEIDNLYLKNIANVTDIQILKIPSFENKIFYNLLEIRWYIFEIREDKKIEGPQRQATILYLTKLVSTSSEVLIQDEGWMPLVIFPTAGAGNSQNIYKNTSADYTFEINKLPVLTQLFLFPTKNLNISKPFVIKGEVILGDSAVITEVDRMWYPFDKYSSELEIEPQYLTKFKLEDAKMQNFIVRSSAIKKDFNEITLNPHERYKLNLIFERKNIFESFVFPTILLSLSPIPIVLKFKGKNKIRCASYFVALIAYIGATHTTPENIEYFYPLKIIILTFFTLAIILIEFKYNKIKFRISMKFSKETEKKI